ncbi:hypothetical protein C8R45DRAFT_1125245 [Mycena sanguinolenta]|nr:hypothetical protein C8R45DRAFT_1125245 [Mycena sanguinolenta]
MNEDIPASASRSLFLSFSFSPSSLRSSPERLALFLLPGVLSTRRRTLPADPRCRHPPDTTSTPFSDGGALGNRPDDASSASPPPAFIAIASLPLGIASLARANACVCLSGLDPPCPCPLPVGEGAYNTGEPGPLPLPLSPPPTPQMDQSAPAAARRKDEDDDVSTRAMKRPRGYCPSAEDGRDGGAGKSSVVCESSEIYNTGEPGPLPLPPPPPPSPTQALSPRVQSAPAAARRKDENEDVLTRPMDRARGYCPNADEARDCGPGESSAGEGAASAPAPARTTRASRGPRTRPTAVTCCSEGVDVDGAGVDLDVEDLVGVVADDLDVVVDSVDVDIDVAAGVEGVVGAAAADCVEGVFGVVGVLGVGVSVHALRLPSVAMMEM